MKSLLTGIISILACQLSFAQYGDYSVRVEVEGNGYAHFTIVYFEDDGWNPPSTIPTYGWDGCCDALLNMGNPWQPHTFTQVVAPPASPNNHRLSINGLPHVFEHTEVPLGFLPGELAQYTFTFEELYTLPVGMGVELEDHAQSVTQDLILDSTYTTWAAVSDDEERFTLHFYPDNVTSASVNQDKGPRLTAYSDDQKLVVQGLGNAQNQSGRLLDMFGRVVWSQELIEPSTTLIIDRSLFATGIYIFELITDKTKRQTLKISI